MSRQGDGGTAAASCNPSARQCLDACLQSDRGCSARSLLPASFSCLLHPTWTSQKTPWQRPSMLTVSPCPLPAPQPRPCPPRQVGLQQSWQTAAGSTPGSAPPSWVCRAGLVLKGEGSGHQNGEQEGREEKMSAGAKPKAEDI